MNRKHLLLSAVFAFSAAGLVACGDNSAEDEIEDAVDDVEDAADEVGDDMEDAADDVADDVEDATDGEPKG